MWVEQGGVRHHLSNLLACKLNSCHTNSYVEFGGSFFGEDREGGQKRDISGSSPS